MESAHVRYCGMSAVSWCREECLKGEIFSGLLQKLLENGSSEDWVSRNHGKAFCCVREEEGRGWEKSDKVCHLNLNTE